MTSVPVYVIPADAADADTATVQRIVQQMVANDRRKDLTNGQRARAIQQMLDTGMSATKVAKKLRRGRDFARQRWPFGQHKMTVCLMGANRRPDPLRQARRWLRPMVSRGDEVSALATTVAAQSVPRDANAICPGGGGSALVTRCLSSLAA